MKYIAAFMLLKLANTDPSVSKIKDIFDSVGANFDEMVANSVLSKLEGKSLEELLEKGRAKMAGFSVAASTGAAPVAATAQVTTTEEKKAKEPEPEEESDGDIGFGLFD